MLFLFWPSSWPEACVEGQLIHSIEYKSELIQSIKQNKHRLNLTCSTQQGSFFRNRRDVCMLILTSPQRPTLSMRSLRPSDKSTIHLLTALLLLSGVRSSSAISTQPSERTAKRIGRSLHSGSALAG